MLGLSTTFDHTYYLSFIQAVKHKLICYLNQAPDESELVLQEISKVYIVIKLSRFAISASNFSQGDILEKLTVYLPSETGNYKPASAKHGGINL